LIGSSLKIEEFTIRFIRNLRRDDRVKEKPSLRQGIALIHFLISKYFRLQRIKVEDLINAAVKTTYFEDQKVAKEIAMAILFPGFLKKIPSKIQKEQTTIEKIGDLSKLLAELKDLEPDIDFETLDAALNNYEKIISFFEKYLEKNLAVKKYLEEEELIDEIFRQEICSIEDYNEFLDSLFKIKKESLTYKDLKFFKLNNRLQDYLNDIVDLVNKIISLKLLNKPEWQDLLCKTMKNDLDIFSRAIKSLKDTGCDKNLLENYLKKGVQECKDLLNYLNLVNKSDIFAPAPNGVFQYLDHSNLTQVFKLARSLDSKFNSSLVQDIFNKALDQKLDLGLNELIEGFNLQDSWKQSLQNLIDENLKNLDFSNNFELLTNIKMNFNRYQDVHYRDIIVKTLERLADEMMGKIQDPGNFLDFLKFLVNENISFGSDEALNWGKQIGCSLEAILEIIGKDFDLVLKMIDKGVNDFYRYFNLLNNISLNNSQKEIIIEKSIQNNQVQVQA